MVAKAAFDNVNVPVQAIVAPRIVNIPFKGPVTLIGLAKSADTTVDRVTIIGISIVTAHNGAQTTTQTIVKLSIAN